MRSGKKMDVFERDKTHQSLFECGKRLGRAFTMVVILLVLSTMITFSTAVGENINIPIFNLKLDRLHAAVALIPLMSIGFFRYACFSYYERILRLKMYATLEATNETIINSVWYLDYPSVDKFFSLAHKFPGFVSRVGKIAQILFDVATFIIPIVLLAKLGFDTSFSIIWWCSSVLSMVFVICGLIILNDLPWWDSQSQSDILEKLDQRIDS